MQEIWDVDLIRQLGSYPRGGRGNPFLYPCLENPMDCPLWWLQSTGSLSQTRLKQLSAHTPPTHKLILQLRNLALFSIWEDARVWVHWNHSFDKHLSYLGARILCFLTLNPLSLSSWWRLQRLRTWQWAVHLSGEGNGTPLQYSCLKNPMDGGAWKAAVHGVAEGRTRLGNFTFTHQRRKWQPTPVFLPGESQGPGSLVGCRLWGCRVAHDWGDLAAAAAAVMLGEAI